MAKFLDYDPLRGVTEYEDRDWRGRLQIRYEQDVEPIIELAKTERLNGLADKAGREGKNDFYLYARIPPVVILELKYKHGCDIFDKNHQKRAFELIDREYPYLKTTERRHRVNGTGIGG
jgi:hypothetical protein